ncbi:MAG TPA: vWA domain-containing protein [Myxococcota bacterium]|nr:vWA domain-containing protein [Myxococcota bacterium]
MKLRLLPSLGLLVAASASAGTVSLRIDSPTPGETVRNRVHLAPIQGSASASGERPAGYDVMVVIDVSRSTEGPSGVDVDGDGVFGVNPTLELLPEGSYPEGTVNTDPGDSILEAEIKAARSLIQSLDPKRVRVGVIQFSGDVDPATNKRARPDQQDALLESPLSSDFGAAYGALEKIRAEGPHGATDFAAAIALATRELKGLTGAASTPREDARKVVLFLTDGTPSFPIGRSDVEDPGDRDLALTQARIARSAEIKINVYAIGPGALAQPVAATEMAKLTQGTYTAVQNPGDIIAVLQGVSFSNVDDVVVSNLTTGEFSSDVELAPDGSFKGFVPVKEGANRLRVTALASDGTHGSVELDLNFQVAGLSDREMARELERIRERNRQLELLVERKRIEEFRAAEKQRKELEIQIDGTDKSGAKP